MPCAPAVESRCHDAGVIVRLHKIIYKFNEDLEDIVHDVKLIEARERGESTVIEVQGSANVIQTFNVTSTRDKRSALVFGSRVTHGTINVKSKVRAIGVGGNVIVDDLAMKSLN